MSTPAAPAPKLSLSEVFGLAFEVVSDIQTELDPSKTTEQKRQALIDAAVTGFAVYAEAKGRAFDKQAALQELVAIVDSGLALYKQLGL